MIRARAFAKLNLYLAVLGKRPDGYHEIETIFQSISLADELTFEPSEDLEVTCSIPELSGPRNLAYSTADQLRAAAGIRSGAKIHIEKRIPVAAGLAGGSADAAATLLALDKLWGIRAPHDLLAGVAGRVGSDVPFCMIGGTAFGTGSGTELSKMSPLSDRPVVVGKPEGDLLAVDVYAAFDEQPVPARRPSAVLRAFLDVEQEGDICPLLENALEPAVIRLVPQVSLVRSTALASGASCALVSGSGPTVFAVTHTQDQAQSVADALGPICEFVSICRPVGRGVELSTQDAGLTV